MPPARKPLHVRFWPKVDKSNKNGCWLWTASTNKLGYGQIGGLKPTGEWTMLRATRVALELSGVNMTGLQALHKCNNPICVRVHPDHVYPGIQADNSRDVIESGSQRGEKNPMAKLSDEQVEEIKLKRNVQKMTLATLAEEYGVRESCISRIANGRRRATGRRRDQRNSE